MMGPTSPPAAAPAGRDSRPYRPYSLRPQHLLFIASIALLLFGFVEVGLQTLPHASPVSFAAQQAAQSTVISKRFVERQLAVGGIVAPSSTSSPASSLPQVDTTSTPTTSSNPTTSSDPSISVIELTATAPVPSVPLVGAAPPADYVAVAKVTTIEPIINNFVQPLAITTPTPEPIVAPAFVTTPAIVSPVVVSPVVVTPVPGPSTTPLPGAAPPAAYVDTQKVSTVPAPATTPTPLAANNNNINNGQASGQAATQPANQPVNQPVNQPAGASSPVAQANTIPNNGGAAIDTQPLASTPRLDQGFIAAQTGTSGVELSANVIGTSIGQIGGSDSRSATFQIVKTVVSGSSGLQTILSSVLMKPTAVRTGVQATATISSDINQLTTSQKTGDGEVITMTWPLWKVFVGGYLPLLVAVIYRVLWADVYANVKMIEPFSQLARPEGAAISDIAHLYYLSTSLVPEQLISLAKGHWMMFLTSATYISVAGMSPLASEVLFLDTHYDCPHPDLNSPSNPCWPPQLSINPVIARLLQAVLCIVAALTIGLLWFLRCRQPRLHFDPSTIAGVASMMRHPQVAQDFRNFDHTAALEDLRDGLSTRVYTITNYQDETSTWRSELIPLQDRQPQRVTAERRPVHPISAWCQLHIDLLLDLWLLYFLTAALIVVTIYLNIQDTSGFNKFFNSNTFGPRFLMSSIGTIIALNFRRLEREAHTIAPYRSLFKGPSTAETTIDLHRPKSPFLAFHYMLRKRHYVPAVIAFAAMLAEALIIALAGVPYSPGQVFMELLVCGYLSVTILCIMILAIIALLWWRRAVPALPHVPDMLISAMCYAADLCHATVAHRQEICDDKKGVSVSCAEVDAEGERRYVFAKVNDERGFERWAIREATECR